MRAPMLLGETVEFAALPNGDLIVDDESGDEGDELELVVRDGTASLTADGKPTGSHIRELERAGQACGPDVAVRAERLDGDLWEVRAAAL